MSKENFKRFVKSNPNIIDYVKENNAKWQDLYEVYELYGEDENVWNKYVNAKFSFRYSWNSCIRQKLR